jgi:hypothetical protein
LKIRFFFFLSLFIYSSFGQESDYKQLQVFEKQNKTNISFTKNSLKGGFNELLPYAVSVPDQENAGSCLFMSHTGALEILINHRDRKSKNLVNFSERYFMNLSKAKIGEATVQNWRTDNIYRLNEENKIYLNKDLPYMKGWFIKNDDQYQIVGPDNKGAQYGTKANWAIALDQLSGTNPKPLPLLEREVIYSDKDNNQWNVEVMPEDIIEKAKHALRTRKSPLIAIYNHTGFWHAVVIYGYNDHTPTQDCPFTKGYAQKMNKRAKEISDDALTEKDPKKKRKLERKAAKFRKRGESVQMGFNKEGGCQKRGVFYVRDSIYPNKDLPSYDYDPTTEGEESPLNSPLILREYQWLKHAGNHLYQIYAL